jgi:peptidoglycan/xylan/chitin deacetylase (PgdA/CDA1 family)
MVKNGLKLIFTKLAPALKILNPKKPHFLVLMFHSVLKDEEFKSLQNVLDPGIHISLTQFEEIIKLCKESGYQFVSPNELKTKNEGKYLLLTFDDGYKNNQNILPILKKYEASAVIFINASFIKNQKISPWDHFYFEGRIRGKNREQILKEYSKRPEIITSNLEELKPLLPLTEFELQDLASNDEIYIGNHSFVHEIHSNFSGERAFSEIIKAQEFLDNLKINTVRHFAFPEGQIHHEILPQLEKYFDYIHTVEEGLNPVNSNSFLLKRYGVNSSQKSDYQVARFTI